ncbi:hypothetical protein SANTM175S_08314 [Streptomyces antimycoticus]
MSFDIAALELYLPLVSGAAVVIADRDTVRDPAALLRLADEAGATVLQGTPSGQALVAHAPTRRGACAPWPAVRRCRANWRTGSPGPARS